MNTDPHPFIAAALQGIMAHGGIVPKGLDAVGALAVEAGMATARALDAALEEQATAPEPKAKKKG